MKNDPEWDKKGKNGKKWDMLLGQFASKLNKTRVSFPKRFREILGDKLIVTKGFEKSLIIVSESGWRSLLEGTEGEPFINPEARQTQRFLLGGATFAELDEKGRFILPEYLQEHAHLDAEVVFIGMSRYVELWDKKEWEEYNKGLQENISTIASRLSREGKKQNE